MTSHSEESRHHYSFLHETTSKLEYETDVNLFSADGKVWLNFKQINDCLMRSDMFLPRLLPPWAPWY